MNSKETRDSFDVSDAERDRLIAEYVAFVISKQRPDFSPLLSAANTRTTKQQLRKKLSVLNQVILYLVDYLLKSLPELLPIRTIEESIEEIDTLFTAIKKRARMAKRSVSNAGESELAEFASLELERLQDTFRHVNKSHLKGDVFSWTTTQEKRTFRLKVLERVLAGKGLDISRSLRKILDRFEPPKS